MRTALSALLAVTVFFLASCGGKTSKDAPPQPLAPIKAESDEAPTPAQVKKEERPNIKVRRGKDGTYTWEISGKDMKSILDADRTLNRRLKTEAKEGGRPSKGQPSEE